MPAPRLSQFKMIVTISAKLRFRAIQRASPFAQHQAGPNVRVRLEAKGQVKMTGAMYNWRRVRWSSSTEVSRGNTSAPKG
jgi:hypothetical protein